MGLPLWHPLSPQSPTRLLPQGSKHSIPQPPIPFSPQALCLPSLLDHSSAQLQGQRYIPSRPNLERKGLNSSPPRFDRLSFPAPSDLSMCPFQIHPAYPQRSSPHSRFQPPNRSLTTLLSKRNRVMDFHPFHVLDHRVVHHVLSQMFISNKGEGQTDSEDEVVEDNLSSENGLVYLPDQMSFWNQKSLNLLAKSMSSTKSRALVLMSIPHPLVFVNNLESSLTSWQGNETEDALEAREGTRSESTNSALPRRFLHKIPMIMTTMMSMMMTMALLIIIPSTKDVPILSSVHLPKWLMGVDRE